MRRKRGEGNVVQRADGLWRGTASAGYRRDGSRRRVYVYSATEAECRRKLRAKLKEIDSGNFAEPTKLTVDGVIGRYAEAQEWKGRTRSDAESIIKNWIQPFIGARKARDLQPHQIQAWLQDLQAAGAGDRTAQKAYTLAKASFAQATTWRALPWNPFEAVKKPKYQAAKRIDALSADQVRRLLDAAREHGCWPMVALGLCTGLRWGEQFALQWDSVGSDYITITRALNQTGKLETPKTSAGTRRISLEDLHPTARQALEELRQQARIPWLFPAPMGGPWMYRNWARRLWEPVQQSAGVSTRWHDLRHTTASYLIEQGMPITRLAHIIGHSKPSITIDVYGHLIGTAAGHHKEMFEALAR